MNTSESVQKVLEWVAFYNDDKKYDSGTFKPEDLPSDGVQWIVEVVEGGKQFVHGMEYYRWTGDSWAGGGPKDLKRWILAYYPDSKWATMRWTPIVLIEIEDWIREECPEIKLGLWISDAEYQKIAKKAESCCDN